MNKINKSRLKLLLIGTFFLTLILIVSGCSEKIEYEVLYEVTGSATEIYYFTPEGQQIIYNPSTPWSYSFITDDESQTVNLGAMSGVSRVYVRMYINGNLVNYDSDPAPGHAFTGTRKISAHILPDGQFRCFG